MKPPEPEEKKRRDRIVGARHRAARTALRIGAGNTVGLTRDELRALADDGLMKAEEKYEEQRSEAELSTFAYPWIRGAVLHAIRKRRRILAREVPAVIARRSRDRAMLDDLGAGVDADAGDLWTQTDDDLAEAAAELAADGMLALILGRAARATGTAEGILIARETLEQIEEAVGALPPADRRLIRAYFHEQQTLDAIAAATGTPTSTLHDHLAAAVRALRRRLGVARR